MVADQHSGVVALSVHGPLGVLDLTVPTVASAGDVAAAYAAQVGLRQALSVHTPDGALLPWDRPLLGLGVQSGALLVVTEQGRVAASRPGQSPVAAAAGGGSGGWSSLVAGLLASGAAVAAIATGDSVAQLTGGLLWAAALVGVLPFGRGAGARALAAPVFSAAATVVWMWDPAWERLPMLLGLAAIAAAVTAAVARSLAPVRDEALTVWMYAGGLVFVITGVASVLGAPPGTVWPVLLLLVALAARYVPQFAIDVPDDALIDLQRLAITAWSARDGRPATRARIAVREAQVATIAARGTRMVVASAAALLLLSAVVAPMAVASVTLPIDRIGVRVLVFCTGASLLFAARSHRHPQARVLLRAAGLVCWTVLTVTLLPSWTVDGSLWVTGVAVGSAALLVIAAVATGRGWRSLWWSRRAEIGEALSGAFALAAMVVSTGLVRNLWEFSSSRFGS
ncbi:hypothetical protein [Nocardioides limicola]|uniref:hypothetical protein n=1 Tax=Nocardioides limicola TaxID=2803368 RepID=UPI00193B331D|nr:hypothetical protein [Nocardioides sp. DJM-14]